jgi:hypothetical protein
VRGMSAAVMPMRKTVSAPAIFGSAAAHAIASSTTAALARPVADFLVRIAQISFSNSMIISYATACNGCANDGVFRRIAIDGTTPCDCVRRKDTSA